MIYNRKLNTNKLLNFISKCNRTNCTPKKQNKLNGARKKKKANIKTKLKKPAENVALRMRSLSADDKVQPFFLFFIL